MLGLHRRLHILYQFTRHRFKHGVKRVSHFSVFKIVFCVLYRRILIFSVSEKNLKIKYSELNVVGVYLSRKVNILYCIKLCVNFDL